MLTFVIRLSCRKCCASAARLSAARRNGRCRLDRSLNDGPSAMCLRDLYTRMLMVRAIDDCAWHLHEQGHINFVASCRGHEAAQVGSAACIEIGKDFTLPYYRDLGVVLTIGMTPYEIFRTYLQTYQYDTSSVSTSEVHSAKPGAMLHWGYHKRNMVTEALPTAAQALHAAGIAFACKLRKAPVVTVDYCSDGATTEADFYEAISFSALHQLPVVFVCEQDCTHDEAATSYPHHGTLQPGDFTYQRVDGGDVLAVYEAMQQAMHHARTGHGPVLLDLCVIRLQPPPDNDVASVQSEHSFNSTDEHDPLLRCQHLLQQRGDWDEAWANQLDRRIKAEIEHAMQDAMRDTFDTSLERSFV
jgi:2-oxoisovalerate dehydrogenase E1 component alpha subunit